MSNKHIRWLYDELPKLKSLGIIDDAADNAIRNHYGEPSIINYAKLFLAIFGVIGAVLIVSGMILIVAYNWDELPILIKTVFAFLPMIVAQIMGGWVLLRKNDSMPWREAISVSIILTVALCIGLISQIYNLGGELRDFLLVWLILSIPVMYIFRSFASYVLVAAILPWWALQSVGDRVTPHLLWPFFFAIVAYAFWIVRKNASLPQSRLMLVASFGMFAFCIGASMADYNVFETSGVVFVYMTFFSVMYLLTKTLLDNNETEFPELKAIGIIGLAGFLIFTTFSDSWKHEKITSSFIDISLEGIGFMGFATLIVFAGIVVLWAVLASRENIRKGLTSVAVAAAPLVFVLNTVLTEYSQIYLFPATIQSAMMLWLGIAMLVEGFRRESLIRINFGTLTICVLVLLRFFDSDFPYLARGFAFILVGCAFVYVNYLVVKSQRKRKLQTPVVPKPVETAEVKNDQ